MVVTGVGGCAPVRSPLGQPYQQVTGLQRIRLYCPRVRREHVSAPNDTLFAIFQEMQT